MKLQKVIFSFLNSSSGGNILHKAFLNSPPSFMAAKSSVKIENIAKLWSCHRAFFLCFPNPLILTVIQEQIAGFLVK